MQNRRDLIQQLIDKYKYNSYLEIGVGDDPTYNYINISQKIGVDPYYDTDFKMTSDDFFAQNEDKYDIIFIDGLHQWDVVYRDIMSSLDCLNSGGTIICHDMWPLNENMASHQPVWGEDWTGDCYKGLLKVLQERDDLWVHVLYDFDCGTTIIRKTGSNPYLKRNIPEWNISVEDWHNESFRIGLSMSIEEYLEKSSEVVICAIAKQEQDYLEDWCRWHLDLGFDRIYLYDNNEENSNEYYEWLKELFPDKIEIRSVRGLKGQQILQYKSFYEDGIFQWVMYLDIDEYMQIKKDTYSNIKEFLNTFPDAGQFSFQWQCYKANPEVSPIDKPIYEYCEEPVSDAVHKDSRNENINGWMKSIIKSGYNIGMNEHFAWGDGLVMRDCLGNETCSTYFNHRDHSRDTIWINHYLLRNIEEFYYKKYLRGHAGLDMSAVDGYTWWNWNQNLNYFNDIQGVLSYDEQMFLKSKGYRPDWIFRPFVDVYIHCEPSSMSWIYPEKDKLLRNILYKSDSRVTINNECDGDDAGLKYYYFDNFSFLSNYWIHTSFLSAWMNPLPEKETYSQPNIIFNIGYNIKYACLECDDLKKSSIIEKELNRWNEVFSQAAHDIIEHPERTVVLKDSIEYDNTCAGMKDIVDEFLTPIGIPNRGCRIPDNSYMMSIDEYMIIYRYFGEFTQKYGVINMQDTINAYKENRSTIYDAWQFIYTSIISDLEIL